MKSVFISSTFKDMQAERDLLHERIFPRLRKIVGEYGEDIQELDLRWGVDTIQMSEEESGHQVLRVCIDAIDRCRPYIIVLLGERYGWIPDAALVDSIQDERINTWYEDQMSITNLEIKYGALSETDTLKNCIFCFRDPDVLTRIDETYRSVYAAEDPAHAERLRLLKEHIRGKEDAVILDYEADWDETHARIAGLEAFGETLFRLLEQMIRRDFAGRKAKHPMEQLRLDMKRTQEQYLSSYIHRYPEECAVFQNIRQAVAWGDGAISAIAPRTLLLGSAGCGKSALMACLADSVQKRDPYTPRTILYFSGNSGCQSVNTLKDYMIYRLEQLCGEVHVRTGDRDSRLRALAEKTRDLKIFCFIDGLEQMLEQEKGNRFDLLDLCPNIYYVLSAFPEFKFLETMNTYSWKLDICLVEELTVSQRKELILRTSAKRGKKLDDLVTDLTAREPGAGNPLYLSMLLQRYFMMDQTEFEAAEVLAPGMEGLHRYMERLLREMPDEAEPMAEYLLQVTGQRFGLSGFREILFLLALSRYGLTEQELEALLEMRGMKFLQIEFQQLVSYLYDAFSLREDGKWMLGHRLIREAVLNRSSEAEKEAAMELLIRYSLEDPAFLEREGFYYILEQRHPASMRVLGAAEKWTEKQDLLDITARLTLWDDAYRDYFLRQLKEVEIDAVGNFWNSFVLDLYGRKFDQFLAVVWRELTKKEVLSPEVRCRSALKLVDYNKREKRFEEVLYYLHIAEDFCQEMAEPQKSIELCGIAMERAWHLGVTDWSAAEQEFKRMTVLLAPWRVMKDREQRKKVIFQDIRNKLGYSMASGYDHQDYKNNLLHECLAELETCPDAERDDSFRWMEANAFYLLSLAYQATDVYRSLEYGQKALDRSEELCSRSASIANLERRMNVLQAVSNCYKKGYQYPYWEEYMLCAKRIFDYYPSDYWKAGLAYGFCAFSISVDDVFEYRHDVFSSELRRKGNQSWKEGRRLYEELVDTIADAPSRYRGYLYYKAKVFAKSEYLIQAIQLSRRGIELIQTHPAQNAKLRYNAELDLRDFNRIIAESLCELCRGREALPYARESVRIADKLQKQKEKLLWGTIDAKMALARTLYLCREDDETLQMCENVWSLWGDMGQQESEKGQTIYAELNYIKSRIFLKRGMLDKSEDCKKIFENWHVGQKNCKEFGQYLILEADLLAAKGEQEAVVLEAWKRACVFWTREWERVKYAVDRETGHCLKAIYYSTYCLYHRAQLTGEWFDPIFWLDPDTPLTRFRLESANAVICMERDWMPVFFPAFARLEEMVPLELAADWRDKLIPVEPEKAVARAALLEAHDPFSCSQLIDETAALYDRLEAAEKDYTMLTKKTQQLAERLHISPTKNPLIWEELVDLFSDHGKQGVQAWYHVLELCRMAYRQKEYCTPDELSRLYTMTRMAFVRSGWEVDPKGSDHKTKLHIISKRISERTEWNTDAPGAGRNAWDAASLPTKTLELILESIDGALERESAEPIWWDAKNACAWELTLRTGEKHWIRKRLKELTALEHDLKKTPRVNDPDGWVKHVLAERTGNLLIDMVFIGGDEWLPEILGFLVQTRGIRIRIPIEQLMRLRKRTAECGMDSETEQTWQIFMEERIELLLIF